MSALLRQPEHGGHASGPSPNHRELHPVLDWSVLRLAHAPHVALGHVVGHEHLLGVALDDPHLTILWHDEGLVVRSVLLRLCSHEPDVGRGAYLGRIQLAILLAILDHSCVDAGVAPIWKHELRVAQGIFLGPHAPCIADCCGHGGIHNDVGRHMQVGDATTAIHIRQGRPLVVACHEVRFDLGLLGMPSNLGVDVANAVVRIHAQLLEKGSMLLESILVEDLHAVAEENWVRNFHHGRLEVQAEDSSWLCALHLLLVELSELCYSHHARVDDFS
mmetsp:Transcript_13450/g.32088  ORF Transcript_13450/g.32088 Transcript_13450/m.32088 type:complete len:275 (-) Transcript_13450:1144-1968(-)